MKIACVDKTASNRLSLQKFIDDSFEKCRYAIGHTTFARTYPTSLQEALINTSPDIVVIGSGYTAEESYMASKEVSEVHKDAAVIVILHAESFSLRSLRRFERVCSEVFTKDESPIRLVHKLCSIAAHSSENKKGNLIVVNGVKGGIGVTSIVSGLAHASQALGFSSIVVDLSESSVFAQYMSLERWYSTEMASIVLDKLVPDESIIKRCVSNSPNGVEVFLPPSGGKDVREMWLRDANRFEVVLSTIEQLKELYDVILVDLSRVEGILPFALTARSEHHILATSNQPSSVHLLTSAVSEALDIPGDGQLHILINLIQERGLTKEDVMDFLFVDRRFNDSMTSLPSLKFDRRAESWIGSDNTFYTEASRTTQKTLESIAQVLVDYNDKGLAPVNGFAHVISKTIKGRKLLNLNKRSTNHVVLGLPNHGDSTDESKSVIQECSREINFSQDGYEDHVLYEAPEQSSNLMNGQAR